MEQELKRGGFFTLVGVAAGFPWRGPPGTQQPPAEPPTLRACLAGGGPSRADTH